MVTDSPSVELTSLALRVCVAAARVAVSASRLGESKFMCQRAPPLVGINLSP